MNRPFRKRLLALVVSLGTLCYPILAQAYIGPGLGTGALAAVLGTLAGLLMLIVGVVWYPLKKLIRFLRSRK